MKINSNSTSSVSESFRSHLPKAQLNDWVGEALGSSDPQATLTEKITQHLSSGKKLSLFEKEEINEFSQKVLLASHIVYDRSESKITVHSKASEDGTANSTEFPAGNQTTSSSNGAWPEGKYNFSWYNKHEDAQDPNGSFGSHGNFIFDVKDRTGMGVHAGRKDKGPTAATEGCIRTTDEATLHIKNLHNTDPLTHIIVQE